MPIGQVIGAHGELQHLLDLVEQLERRAALAVELVDEGHDRRVAQPADFHQLDRALLDALGAVDHHQRRIHRGQRAVGVLGEVLVARRVEQVDDAAVVRELHHRRGHRDAALLLEAHPVGGRVARRLAALHRAGHLDRAAEQQQLLGQRGLAGVGVRDDREGAAARPTASGSGAHSRALARGDVAQHHRILAAADRLVVPPADADLAESRATGRDGSQPYWRAAPRETRPARPSPFANSSRCSSSCAADAAAADSARRRTG